MAGGRFEPGARLREEKKQGTWAERRPGRWEQMRAMEERRTRGRVFLWCLIENKGARKSRWIRYNVLDKID